MRKLSIALCFALVGCSHTPIRSSASPAIVSFESEFREFTRKAAKLPAVQQLRLWDEIVEAPNQEFYDSMVWPRRDMPGFQEQRARRLTEAFGEYFKNRDRILELFTVFPAEVRAQLAKFRRHFPNADLDQAIVAAIAPTFNGKTGRLSNQQKGVLAFGIDTLVKRQDDLNTLFTHELFHLHHAEQSGIRDDGSETDVSLWVPLWTEGLATYVSHELNPDSEMKFIFLDERLAKLRDSDLSRTSRDFIKVANQRVFGGGTSDAYRDWFTMAQGYQPGKPPRMGYWLGFKVVERLRKTNSLEELAKWDEKKVLEVLPRVLSELSN
jgi:hypothetical protein